MTSLDPFPTSINSLHFNSSLASLSQTITSLHLSTRSTHNRLASIDQDAFFVHRFASHLNLPLVTNERCGSWYVSPDNKAGSVYFKSTDGHFGQWAFSKRRLNLHVLDIIDKSGGCIIVDSTRRGKSMPDALAKTIPIWCTVVNRLIFEGREPGHELQVPSDVVGASEYAQIEAKLDTFVRDAKALIPDLALLRKSLRKPLRPLWITPASFPREVLGESAGSEFYYVVCCTASRQVHGAEASEGSYIQGAGDDSETWSHGLTPTIFWRHRQELLEALDEVLPALIEEYISKDKQDCDNRNDATLVTQTNAIYLGNIATTMAPDQFDGVIICRDASSPKKHTEERDPRRLSILNLHCGIGKLGSRALRAELSHVIPFVSSLAAHTKVPRILFACSTGKDLSIGVALVVLCVFFDDDYAFWPDVATKPETIIDKPLIRRRLAWITTTKPEANPSRSTLQAVNSFLIERPP